ncbi:MAG: hypothetical protein GY769_07065 [bacterium]|nr:hypothetical protein [bacterium]
MGRSSQQPDHRCRHTSGGCGVLAGDQPIVHDDMCVERIRMGVAGFCDDLLHFRVVEHIDHGPGFSCAF